MLKRLLHITFFLGFILSLGGCREDLFDGSQFNAGEDGTFPVEFEFRLPDDFTTRGVEYAKRTFAQGDIIHIQGTFNMTDGTTVKKYGAMVYDESSKSWAPYRNLNEELNISTMTWPNNAVTATFKAFYISGSSYLLQQGNSTPDMSLSGLAGSRDYPDTDPLQSIHNEEIEYGHTIILTFEHACAYLQIEELPAGVTSVFWLTQEGTDANVSPSFYNGYNLTLSDENELTLEFVQMEDKSYNNAVYVAAQGESYVNEEGLDRIMSGFYLAPGEYKSFVLGYPGANDMIRYLSYTKKETDISNPEDFNPNNELEANGVYSFNVSKSSGLTLLSPPEDDKWDDDMPPWQKVDAEKFLWAIIHNEEYYNELGVHIIDGNNGLGPAKLLCNVDMQYQKYTVFPPSETNGMQWFDPSMGNDNVFDGGKHFINNMGVPLFRENNGLIRDLGICEAKVDIISVETQNADQVEIPYIYSGYDLSRNGVVCGFNTGTIQNVTFIDNIHQDYTVDGVAVEMNVSVYSTSDGEAHNIGVIAGSNSGTISDVYFSGEYKINIENYENVDIIPTVNIGGLIGQNVGRASNIAEVPADILQREITTPKFEIVNNLNGPVAKYAIGGVAGANNGGNLENIIIPDIFIDSRNSSGLISTIGGLVGSQSNSSSSYMASCMATGKVFSGKVQKYEYLESYALTGGIAGIFYVSGDIHNCRSVVDVYGPYGNNYVPGVEQLYGTGGAFGRIDDEKTGQGYLYDIIANGLNLQGPTQYIGNFTGIAPSGKNWDYYKDFQIVVRSHSMGEPPVAIDNIGINIE